jgi:hypothetical protein
MLGFFVVGAVAAALAGSGAGRGSGSRPIGGPDFVVRLRLLRSASDFRYLLQLCLSNCALSCSYFPVRVLVPV